MVHDSGWYKEKVNNKQNKMYSLVDCDKCYGRKINQEKGTDTSEKADSILNRMNREGQRGKMWPNHIGLWGTF